MAATAAAVSVAGKDRVLRNRAAVRWWLYAVLLVLFSLVIVGGATRMTESGLSITEWKPIHGVIPPLSDAEWQEEFQKYQQIPQYAQMNQDMTLDGFKTIFWWEWAHRLLARGVNPMVAAPVSVGTRDLATAEAKREQIIEAAQSGVNGYIIKPFTAQTLEEKLGKIFERLAASA